MTRPAAVLCLLSAVGIAVGSVVWGTHWKSRVLRAAEATDGPSEAVSFLEEEVDVLRDQNDRLLARVFELETGGGAEAVERFFRPEELETEVEAIRGLKFLKEPEYHVVPQETIDLAVQVAISSSYDDDAFEAMALSFGVLGLTEPMINLQRAWVAQRSGSRVYYDPHSQTILVRKEVDPANPFDRPEVARELALALIDQHGANLAENLKVSGNLDAGLARRSFFIGQASVVADVVSESTLGDQSQTDMPILDDGNPLQLLAAVPIPPFVRQLLTFPEIDGVPYCLELRDAGGGFSVFDRLLAEGALPESTREVMEGEAPEKRELFEDVEPQFEGGAPIFSNTVGMFGIRALLETFIGQSAEDEPRAASGWAGDRFHVFAAGNQDLHAVWLSEWDDEAAADRFVAMMREASEVRIGMTPEDSMLREDAFRIQKILRPSPTRVVFIDAQTKEAVVEIEKQVAAE
ncbi:hypothetical protein [Sulfuriroseicoccus oceanibius]|uniref:Uncharacterized protein n=1 Tax=Sulfuriroseicoccus oceanibius TaxID=2707525 RepID=A0A6B3LD92_9BACT|nr:hypothetical protein [Sulfuriroseicoccus oceanibius]QQL45197.1 hypothetical protein G3M56_001000 [Sulfuriroseicoccus oceanibius]